jgi:predicted nuclease with TOPRIM domain
MSDYLDRLEQRILALEDMMATHNHIAEDDEESIEEYDCFEKESDLDVANRCLEAAKYTAEFLRKDNAQLNEANEILHAKVAALRAENQRLADICEEQDIVIDDLKKAGERLAAAFSAHLSHHA